MPRTPDPEKLKARHAYNCTLLDITRSAIQGEIRRLHPDAATCLPLPDLEIPKIHSQSYTDATKAIFLNLFTPDANSKAPQWRADHSGACPHLGPEGILAVYELIYTWYGLLAAARDYRDAEARRGRLDLSLGYVQYRLNHVASLSHGER
ncbi:hypothetical protein ACGFJT_37050 [Actinomadura geliboluensis]|uniref:hypothetical protein n=1 Tax=Actinomadura geliboluensis TaxID=882440 RepID=UPI003711F7CB